MLVAVVMSLVALLLVVGICIVGMRWLVARVHGHGDIESEFRAMVDDQQCFECNGSGATRSRGELRPCPVCDGTGTLRAPF
jgi:hypothetical protein